MDQKNIQIMKNEIPTKYYPSRPPSKNKSY